jgi:Ca2+-binding RTX toxin-like protein
MGKKVGIGMRLLGIATLATLFALSAVAFAGTTGPQPIDPQYIPKKCKDINGVALQGGPENDDMEGTPNRDLLKGDGGNDRIRGRGDNDCLFGEDDDDRVLGGSGNDNADGGSGDDYIDDGKGRDQIHGHQGDDTIQARHKGDDEDRIRCGQGFDTVVADTTDHVGRDCENVKIRPALGGSTTT